MLLELNAPRTALLSQVEVQSLRDRVLEACAELVEVGAPEGPPQLPLVAEATVLIEINDETIWHYSTFPKSMEIIMMFNKTSNMAMDVHGKYGRLL